MSKSSRLKRLEKRNPKEVDLVTKIIRTFVKPDGSITFRLVKDLVHNTSHYEKLVDGKWELDER